MIDFIQYFKSIAYFLATLILFQSCVAYQKTPSTIEEATSEEEMPIKIITKDGKVHKFRLIEERDDNIVGIKKLHKDYFLTKDVLDFAILEPEPHTVPLETALKHHGTIRILVLGDYNSYTSHEFMKIRQTEETIIGYDISGKDTHLVMIPIDQIEMIQLKDIEKSAGLTTKAIIGASLGIGLIVLIAVVITDMANADWWGS